MKHIWWCLWMLAGWGTGARAQTPVTLHAADGVTVYGSFYPAKNSGAPVLLLFHQAGSGKGEYAPLAPRLVRDGLSCLAIDQRSGDGMYGHNETAAHLGHEAPYLDALPDLEVALRWARTTHPHSRILVWGSSYSASLVFLLAARHPKDIAALLAFSPGEYFDGKPHLVQDAVAQVTVPLFVTCAPHADEEKEARALMQSAASRHKTFYIPKAGVHGSSTLRADKDPAGQAANWRAVEAFLAPFTHSPIR